MVASVARIVLAKVVSEREAVDAWRPGNLTFRASVLDVDHRDAVAARDE